MIERFWRLRNNIFFLRFALFAAAALPRLAGLGRYITPDELIWVFRSVQFQQAVAARQWADSLVSGHPGVTTTWLATLGIRLQILFQPADRAVYDWITHLAFFMPDNMAAFSQLATFLTAVRLVIILVNSLGVVAVYGLARPLFGHFTALLAAFLLALDPFVVGLSGLLHVDALMTTFATLALLALLGAIRPEFSTRRRRGYAALSGLLAAGAVLTKTPALLLTPLAGLFFFFSLFFEAGGEGNGYFGFA
ncbi:MAG: phospholipid carrier-dependent glycosyltransferase, partial [Chloroflexi bacterium]|nr:phospholipid carrier-dependent glycosyltransferase [Chloroflexota bacterium]